MRLERLGTELHVHVMVCCIQLYNRFLYEMNDSIKKVINDDSNYGLKGVY